MTHSSDTDETRLVERVRDDYGRIARHVLDTPSAQSSSCCGHDDPITRDLYTSEETATIPDAAGAASLGCGNPTALTELRDGDVVLDLGSGGGIDVLLSARRVAPSGFAYGLDMTDEMLELARRNQAEAGVENAEFLDGRMEDIPLPDDSVDVVISNCVINLSADKAQVLREAFRVLRPGGRFAVADVVVRGAIDPRIRSSVEAWVGCVAGALDDEEYRALLAQAGFIGIDIAPTRVYDLADAGELLGSAGFDVDEVTAIDGRLISAFVRATKPA
ncbi:MAG: arsenite methyltransferase [Ilumatobacter sp.]|uniref:arsenite methyltransferase n=1 Tax=Ilumatobacter sp. TaxID=1967498 RepID=UPI002608BD88|nr:arsenite methyltransferase [Ilumatobacter sp.]MDJ0768758.1 arsenite methyltransferase [Ilumatobacter sp.]